MLPDPQEVTAVPWGREGPACYRCLKMLMATLLIAGFARSLSLPVLLCAPTMMLLPRGPRMWAGERAPHLLGAYWLCLAVMAPFFAALAYYDFWLLPARGSLVEPEQADMAAALGALFMLSVCYVGGRFLEALLPAWVRPDRERMLLGVLGALAVIAGLGCAYLLRIAVLWALHGPAAVFALLYVPHGLLTDVRPEQWFAGPAIAFLLVGFALRRLRQVQAVRATRGWWLEGEHDGHGTVTFRDDTPTHLLPPGTGLAAGPVVAIPTAPVLSPTYREAGSLGAPRFLPGTRAQQEDRLRGEMVGEVCYVVAAFAVLSAPLAVAVLILRVPGLVG